MRSVTGQGSKHSTSSKMETWKLQYIFLHLNTSVKSLFLGAETVPVVLSDSLWFSILKLKGSTASQDQHCGACLSAAISH